MGKKVIPLQPFHSQKAAQQTAGKHILSSETQSELRRTVLPEQTTSLVSEATHKKPTGTTKKVPGPVQAFVFPGNQVCFWTHSDLNSERRKFTEL